MVRIENAVNRYKGKNGMSKENCSMSIIKSFHESSAPMKTDELSEFSGFGGGRAPEGYCGALYAAEKLIDKSNSLGFKEIKNSFLEEAGSLKCREIRKLGKLPCEGCVRVTAELLNKEFPQA